MQAGKLRYKLTLQKPDGEVRRGIPQTYVDDSQAWGNIQPMKVAESDKNGQLRILGQFQIVIWCDRTINETWRIKHGDEIYNIIEALHDGPVRHETRITAVKDKTK